VDDSGNVIKVNLILFYKDTAWSLPVRSIGWKFIFLWIAL